MVPRILRVDPKTYGRLIRLRKQAERDRAYRVARRLQAVVLNSEGRTSGELAYSRLRVPGSLTGCHAIKPVAWKGCSKGIARVGHGS